MDGDRDRPRATAGGRRRVGGIVVRGELGPLLGAALASVSTDLAYYDPADGWTVEPGRYEVLVGRHALDDQALRAQFAVR